MSEPVTHKLETAGAVLHYDVRDGDGPALLMIGSPMDAGGFVTLASRFPDRTVVTYDPRGIGRSERTDGATESTPDEHADDLHRLITALGGGPVDVFASSGGAVNALALVARHPGQVRTLVAHEPPAVQVVPDRAAALAAREPTSARTYERAGCGAAHGEVLRAGQLEGRVHRGLRRSAGARPGGVRPADRGRRHAQRRADGPNLMLLHALRARFRGAAGACRPGS